jgi:hypothetical protein
MTINQVLDIFEKGSREEVINLVENRVLMPESRLRMFGELLTGTTVSIEHNPMSQVNEYWIYRNGECLATQFYWKDGEYNAQGEHSLYDEYGFNK